MTEPDDRETRQALRAMLADRIGTLVPPAGVYETVRRQHRRRRRAIVGGALVLAVAAVAVPSIALADRPGTPSAADRRCVFPGNGFAPRADRLPVQRDVPGSLGGDAELVTAVLRAGWSGMRAEAGGSLLDPGTARVRMVERVEGQVVALVSVDGLGRRLIAETWVWGPDADHLVAMAAGGVRAPTPVRTAARRALLLATKSSSAMLIKTVTLAGECTERSMPAKPGRESIRRKIDCQARGYGHWHLTHPIRTHFL